MKKLSSISILFISFIFLNAFTDNDLPFKKENPLLYQELLQIEENAPQDLKILLEQLKSENENVIEKAEAILQIYKLREKGNGAILSLIKLFNSNDSLSTFSLGSVKIPENVEFDKDYSFDSITLRDLSIIVLSNIGKSVEKYMIAALMSKDNRIAVPASEVLSNIGWVPSNKNEYTHFWIKRKDLSMALLCGKDCLDDIIEQIILIRSEDILRELPDDYYKPLTSLGEKVIEPLIISFSKHDIDIHEGYARIFIIIGRPALPHLLKAIKKPSAITRKQSIQILENFLNHSSDFDLKEDIRFKSVDPLINLINDSDQNVRKNAIGVLGKIGDYKAIKPLIELIKKDDSYENEIATALASIGRPAAEELFKLMENPKPNLKLFALNLLYQIKEPIDKDLLISLLKNKDSRIRANVAYILCSSKAKEAALPLLKLFKDSNVEVRRIVSQYISLIEDQKIIEPLIEGLKDEDAEVRKNCADSLSNFSNQKVVIFLTAALNDKNCDVRYSATQSLESLKWKPTTNEEQKQFGIAKGDFIGLAHKRLISYDEIINLVDKDCYYSYENALRSLSIVDKRRALKYYQDLLKNDEEIGQRIAVEELAKTSGAEEIEALLSIPDKQIDRIDYDTHCFCSKTLGKIKDNRFIEKLGQSLIRKDLRSSFCNSQGLIESGNSGAIQYLIKYIHRVNEDSDYNLEFRKAVAGLGKFDKNEVFEPILQLLREKIYTEVMIDTIRSFRDKRAIQPLFQLLKEIYCDNQYYSAEIADALDDLGWKPSNLEEKIIYNIAKREWEKCIEMGSDCLDYLVCKKMNIPNYIFNRFTDKQLSDAALKYIGNPYYQKQSWAVETVGSFKVKSAIESLIKILNESDSNLKEKTINALKNINDQKACEPIRLFVNYPVKEVSVASIDALSFLRCPLKSEDVLYLLKSNKLRIRSWASGVLSDMKWKPSTSEELTDFMIANKNWPDCIKQGKKCTDKLLALLKNDEAEIRIGICQALGQTKDISYIKPISDLLYKDVDSSVKAAALNALGLIGNKTANEHIEKFLNTENEKIKSAAINSFGNFRNEDSVSRLINILEKDSDQISKIAAIKALGETENMRAVDPLIKAFPNDNNSELQSAIIKSISKFKSSKITEFLIKNMNHNDLLIRQEILKLLRKLKDPSSVKPLIQAIKSNNLDQVPYIETLNAISPRDATPFLVEIMRKGDWDTAQKAKQLLINNKSDSTVKLIDELYKGSQAKRMMAAEALGKINDKRALKPLISFLTDKDFQIRRSAAKALKEMQLQPRSDEEKVHYFAALGEWGKCTDAGEAAVDYLISLLKDRNEYVREEACRVLGIVGNKKALNPLISMLQNDSKKVKIQALIALKTMKDPIAADPIIKLLDSSDYDIVYDSINALKDIRSPRAVTPLIKLLDCPEPYIRNHAAIALGEIGDKRAVQPLLNALKKPDQNNYDREEFFDNIAEALIKLDDHSIVRPLINILNSGDAIARISVIEILTELKENEAIPSLIKIAKGDSISQAEGQTEINYNDGKDLNIDVQERAIRALGQLEAKDASPILIELLQNNKNDKLRKSAITSLGDLREQQVVPILISLLSDESRFIRKASASSLGEIKDEKAILPLIEAMNDKEIIVREEVVLQLGFFHDDRILTVVRSALKDESFLVRWNAVFSIGELKDYTSLPVLRQMQKTETIKRFLADIDNIINQLEQSQKTNSDR